MRRTILLSLICALFLTGCSLKKLDVPAIPEENDAPAATADIDRRTEAEGPLVQYDNDLTYADLSKLEFWFSSGAGGWGTVVTINPDGSFQGHFGDSDMGDTGPGYPGGTYYTCDFTGKFGALERVDEYSFKTKVLELNYDNVSREEIIDEILYIYSEPYGMDDVDDMYFYLPGAPVDSLDPELKEWIYWSLYDWESSTMAEELNFIAMYNKNGKEGYSSY